MNEFSYRKYVEIVSSLRKSRDLIDYSDVSANTRGFLIIRHDIEYSMARALSLAKIENDNDIKSTYFVQIRNNNYNALSEENIEICKSIQGLGHNIGLHVHLGSEKTKNLLSEKDVSNIVMRDSKVLSSYLEMNITLFSYHRPTKRILTFDKNYGGSINAYGPAYFTLRENCNTIEKSEAKYVSDSNHRWKYGHPFDDNIYNFKKIQLVTHPFSWSEKGLANKDNFLSLIHEKSWDAVNFIDQEISSFPKEFLDKTKRVS